MLYHPRLMRETSRSVAVILAAGVGRRLAPLTDDRPKALVMVGGRTFLDRCLAAVAQAGFPEVLIVTGHRAELIDAAVAEVDWPFRVRSVVNERYAVANNIVSFLTVADQVRGGFCLLNSDIVFDSTILRDVVGAPEGCWLAVDHDEPLGSEEMKVQMDGDGVIRRISKALPAERSAGEYIGIARFDAPGAVAVIRAAETLVRSGQDHLYYEDAFDRAAADLSIRPIPVAGREWTEVDDLADHDRASRVARALDGAGAA